MSNERAAGGSSPSPASPSGAINATPSKKSRMTSLAVPAASTPVQARTTKLQRSSPADGTMADSRHSRPLSTIESVGSVDSDFDALDDDGDKSGDRIDDLDLSYDTPATALTSSQSAAPSDPTPASSPPLTPSHLHPDSAGLRARVRRESNQSSAGSAGDADEDASMLSRRRSVQDLEAQVQQLFERFAQSPSGAGSASAHRVESSSEADSSDTGGDESASFSSSTSSNAPRRRRSRRKYLLTGDLPAVLAEFEALRKSKAGNVEGAADGPLINPALMPQIEAFAAENPTLRIQPAMLVHMITSLQSAHSEAAASNAAASAAAAGSADDVVDVRQILSDSSQMSSGDDDDDADSSDGDSDEGDSDMELDDDGRGVLHGRRDSATLLQRGQNYGREDREETPVPGRPIGGSDNSFDFPKHARSVSISSEDDVIGEDYSASLAASTPNVAGTAGATGPSAPTARKKRLSQPSPSGDGGPARRGHASSLERRISSTARSQAATGSSEGSQPRSRKSSASANPGQVSSPGSAPDEKEILKGKGRARAPPTSWVRPKPKALAQRSRRTSETSSHAPQSPRDGGLSSEQDDGMGVGFGRPSGGAAAARMRQVSHPVTGTHGGAPTNALEPPFFPRSASAGYIFPRASAGAAAADTEAEEDRRFDELSAALSGHSPRSSGQPGSESGSGGRVSSPSLDESSFVGFSTLTPPSRHDDTFSTVDTPLKAGGLPRGLSSPDVPGRGAASQRLAALHADLTRENERLRREKKELQDSIQAKEDEHEAVTADLHGRLEAAGEALVTKRREEKEASATAAQAAEQVASLEAELAAVQKRNKGLEELNAKGREQIESNLAEHGVLRKKLEDLLQEVRTRKSDEEQAVETASSATAEVARLKELLAEKEQRILGLLALEADNDRLVQENLTLSDQVDKLKAELDEKFRSLGRSHEARFNAHGTLLGTPSRRLGAELLSHFNPDDSFVTRMKPAQEEKDESEEEEQPDPDTSAESFIETVTTRVRRSKGKSKARSAPPVEMRDASAQTEAAMAEETEEEKADDTAEAEQSTHTVSTEATVSQPPTYDEAALEKSITERLHPGATAQLEQALVDKWPEYATLSKLLDVRCTAWEAKMLETPRVPPTVHQATANDPAAPRKRGAAQSALLDGLRHVARAQASSLPVLALAFLLGVLLARLLMPTQHHYHFGPYTESATAWRESHSFMLPAGLHTIAQDDAPAGWPGWLRGGPDAAILRGQRHHQLL